jgi:hypothetical protein
MGLMCRPKYFFIWSLILGDIVVCSTSSTPSNSFDSMDASDQPLPLILPPLTPLKEPYDRSPNLEGSVFAERSEEGILDGGSGGSPVLLDLSCAEADAEAEADATLCDEYPVTERDPIDESSPSAIMAVEYDSIVVCSASTPSKSFDSADATDQPPPLMPPLMPPRSPLPYLDRSAGCGGSPFAERPGGGILDGCGGRNPVLLDPPCALLAEPDATLCDEQWYDGKYAPVMTERDDPIDKSSPSAMMAVEYDSGCVGSEDKDSFLATMEFFRLL